MSPGRGDQPERATGPGERVDPLAPAPSAGAVSAPNQMRDRAALSTYSTAVQGVARLGFSVLVGRLGSRELLGQTNSSLSIAVLTSQLGATSTAQAGMRFVAEPATRGDEERTALVARHLANRAALIALVVPTTAAVIASLLLDFDTRHTVATVVISWAYSLYTSMRGIQFGRLGFRHVAVWDTVAAATAISATALVLLLGLTPLALLPLSLGYLVFAVASWPRRVATRVERPLRREIDHFIRFTVVAAVASGGLLQASQLAARYLTGPGGAGDFAAALSLATPASMLAVALSTVLVPPLVAAAGRGDHAAVRQQTDSIMRRLTAIFVGVFGILVLIAPIGIALFYGPDFAASADLLPVLLIAVMLMSISLGAATALQVTRRSGPRWVAALNVAGLVTSVATWVALGSAGGTMGVAVGYLAGTTVTALGLLAAIWWVERQHWVGLAARLAAGTAIIVGLALATRQVTGAAGILLQLGAAVLFALVWGVIARHDVAALWRTLRGTGSAASPA